MRALFRPASVVVVGASPNGAGRRILENFRALSFDGPVAAVNPRYDEVLGFPCVPSLSELDWTPEAVAIALGTNRAAGALAEAGERGVRAAAVFATGFAESGEQGRRLQDELRGVARTHEMAVVGPNCQGLIDFTSGAALYMDSVDPYVAGNVALVSQSGSVATALINNTRGVRWSHAVSSGNEAVLTAADFCEYFLERDEVRVICAFLETIREPERFLAVCERAAAAGTPIVVCKTGRTSAAQAAAAAHSGALAVEDRLVDAALRRHGALRVDSLEELLETAIALQAVKRPRRGRVGAITASGGQIELLLDGAARTSLELPELTAPTRSRLEGILGSSEALTNPLDYWATPGSIEALPALTEAVAQDAGVDVAMLVGDFTVGPTGRTGRAEAMLDAALACERKTDSLLVVLDAVGGAPPTETVERALSRGVLVLSGIASGLTALDNLVHAERARTQVAPVRVAGPSLTTRGLGGLDLLEAAGLSVPRAELVNSADEAVAAAERLGYPVVAKLAGHEIAHKTERNGVVLNLADAAELRTATTRLLADSTGGVLVQEQVVGGIELLLGIHNEPGLGSFLIVGLGGVWTELLDDVQIRAAGLRDGEAEQMLRGLRGYRRLTGARNQRPIDVDAVVDAIGKLDALAVMLGSSVRSIDVNPLIATERGAVAVDALVVEHDPA